MLSAASTGAPGRRGRTARRRRRPRCRSGEWWSERSRPSRRGVGELVTVDVPGCELLERQRHPLIGAFDECRHVKRILQQFGRERVGGRTDHSVANGRVVFDVPAQVVGRRRAGDGEKLRVHGATRCRQHVAPRFVGDGRRVSWRWFGVDGRRARQGGLGRRRGRRRRKGCVWWVVASASDRGDRHHDDDSDRAANQMCCSSRPCVHSQPPGAPGDRRSCRLPSQCRVREVSLPGAGRYRSGIGVVDGEAAGRDTCRMAVRVLGPVGIDGAGPLEPRDRIALGVLAVRNGVTVSPEHLAEALWGDDPPQSWRKQVQIRVSRLRKVLDEDAIETTADGYRLTLEGADVDASQFERLVERGRVLVAGGEPDRAAATYHRALALWQGAPLTDLDGWLPGRSEASRLEELRGSAQEDWLVARLAAGEHRDVAAAAEPLVDEEPLRERRWAVLALAQYRCARQADALRTLARARRTLGEVGLEPGVDLLELEAAILRHDPALAPATAPAVVSAACPYKGLAPYDRADSEAFFGRADEVQVCLDRLRASPLLVVAGPSGCGKSSLVRAGLVPALAGRGRVATVFTPGPDLAATMARSSEARGAAPVLVVDQFEELFTHELQIETVRSFCRALVRYDARNGAGRHRRTQRPARRAQCRRRAEQPCRAWPAAPRPADRRGPP